MAETEEKMWMVEVLAPPAPTTEKERQPRIDRSHYWRLADLEQFPPEDGYRYEIIEGVLIVTPAPNRRHGGVAGNLTRAIYRVLDRHHPNWYLMIQPINLEMETEERTVHCEPDLCIFDRPQEEVIADESLMPVIVIEIVSPSNPGNDYVSKVVAYAALGIPEYWIVDPRNRSVTYLQLDGKTGQYEPARASARLPELPLEPDALFAGIA